jgi:hypothetical protein
MDPSVKDVPESMKLVGPSNYVIWSYKVRMILMQEGLWRLVEPIAAVASSSNSTRQTSGESAVIVNTTSSIPVASVSTELSTPTPRETEQCYRARCIIISMVRDSIILSVIHLTNPQAIWLRLRSMCDIRSSSKRMLLKEQLYSLRLTEGKGISEHLQSINLIVTQLVGLGIDTPDEDLVDITLNSLPKSWSVFRQIQKGREHTPTFPELEGLMLQEELGRNIKKDRDKAEDVLAFRTSNPRGGRSGRSHGRSHNQIYRNDTSTELTSQRPAYQRDLNRKNIQCHKCNKYGHYARECAEVSLEQKIKELQIQLSCLKHPKQSSVNIVEEPIDTNDEDEEEQIPAHLNACIEAFGSDGDDPAELVNICTNVEQAWFLDSGASSHVTGHKPLLTNIHTSSIPSIRTARGQIMLVEG